MNLSLKWLADYVDCGVSIKEFCAGMKQRAKLSRT